MLNNASKIHKFETLQDNQLYSSGQLQQCWNFSKFLFWLSNVWFYRHFMAGLFVDIFKRNARISHIIKKNQNSKIYYSCLMYVISPAYLKFSEFVQCMRIRVMVVWRLLLPIFGIRCNLKRVIWVLNFKDYIRTVLIPQNKTNQLKIAIKLHKI